MPVFESLRRRLRPDDGHAMRMPSMLPCGAAPDGDELPIRLRPLTMDDEDEWNDLRWRNRQWLSPWESGNPMHGPALSFNAWVQRQRRDEADGSGALFVMEHCSRIVGQVSLGAIRYGSMRTGIVGYWVGQEFIGRGYAPLAVAMLADWAFDCPSGPKLHRLEIALLPDNVRSRRVAEKLGAHHEGIRLSYMYVNGEWRDHETYGLLAGDAGEAGFVARLRSGGTV